MAISVRNIASLVLLMTLSGCSGCCWNDNKNTIKVVNDFSKAVNVKIWKGTSQTPGDIVGNIYVGSGGTGQLGGLKKGEYRMAVTSADGYLGEDPVTNCGGCETETLHLRSNGTWGWE